MRNGVSVADGRLSGKLALITGAAQGQGAATALRFVEEGASVVIADVADHLAAGTADRLGPSATHEHLDVASAADWADVLGRHQNVDVLVNNAGIFQATPLLETTPELWQRMVAVNQTGPMLGMQAVGRLMIDRGAGGSIVNISSTAGLVGAEAAAYAATKWALRGMTRSAAREFGPFAIRVNSVHPGFVDTPMLAGIPDLERYLPSIPLGRLAVGADIADLVVFLASDESSYITGSEHIIDGGWRA